MADDLARPASATSDQAGAAESASSRAPTTALASALLVAAGLIGGAVRLGGPGGLTAAVVVGAATYLVVNRQAGAAETVVVGLVASAASIVTTLTALHDPPLDNPNARWGLLEVAALLVLVALLVRGARSPAAWVVVAVLAAGQALWVTRFVPEHALAASFGAAAAWGLGSVVAAGAGGCPRLAAHRLEHRVASERAHQRRQLERDLHDYVAHDLSGIIVQAQAARYVSGDDPVHLRAALGRIEDAGQKAMASMDRALELLKDGQDLEVLGLLAGHPTMTQADDLIASFRASTSAMVETAVTGPVSGLPRVVSATLFRVLVESLTNVRRHAPQAQRVTVVIGCDERTASVTVANDGVGDRYRRPDRPRAGGTGVSSLRSRLEALGGRLTTSSSGEGQWTVTASLPVRGRSSR